MVPRVSATLNKGTRAMSDYCTEGHRYAQGFDDLPTDQGGAGRHRCAGCAYERGF